jgi:hypothetical protein
MRAHGELGKEHGLQCSEAANAGRVRNFEDYQLSEYWMFKLAGSACRQILELT